MRSKISFFNKGLFFSNLKRFSWAAVLETVILFFCFPFHLMTIDTDLRWLQFVTDIMESRTTYAEGANLSICIYAVVLAVMLFRYLHTPKTATALHGMPFSRIQLFFSTFLSGAVLLTAPILINLLFVFIIKATMDIGMWIVAASVVRWAVYAILLSLVLFAFSSMVGMFVGNSAAQLVFTYILHFLPMFFYMCYEALCHMFLYGYHSMDGMPNWLREFPMLTIAHNFSNPCGYYMILFAVLTVVFVVLALLAYKTRPLEQAGNIVVFSWVKPLFKYGVSVCFAVAGFLYTVSVGGITVYNSLQGNLIGNTLLAVLWGALGFVLAQMLVMKTWRIFSAYKELLLCCFAVALLFVGFQCDITGFEKRTVDASEVASVTLGGFYEFPSSDITLYEEENIALALQLHRAAIEQRNSADTQYATDTRVHMEFELKNGTKLSRTYFIKPQQAMVDIYNLEESKQSGFKMLYEDVDAIESIAVSEGMDYKVNYYINDKQAMVEAMRLDLEKRRFGKSYEHLIKNAELHHMQPVTSSAEEVNARYRIEFRMRHDTEESNPDGLMQYTHAIYIDFDSMPATYAFVESVIAQQW